MWDVAFVVGFEVGIFVVADVGFGEEDVEGMRGDGGTEFRSGGAMAMRWRALM
jgi:hypothetical protein